MGTYYYIYCDGVLGVETDVADFKWIYGSLAPAATKQDYDCCVIKFKINLVKEKALKEFSVSDRFQSYCWDSANQTISCRRSILGKIDLGYNISVSEDKVTAEIGKNYYRFVKNRVMNLHGIYWLLSDLANILLLRKGYLTLYASAVHCASLNRGVVCFGPPGMGKTLTATGLCEKGGYTLVGEDIVIANKNRLLSCPWTASYRKKKSNFDSAGSLGRTAAQSSYEICRACEATDFVLLTAGEKASFDKAAFLNKISMLNGYLFNYCASPVVKMLGYFDETYCHDWNKHAIAYLEQMLDSCQYHTVCADDPIQYVSLIDDIMISETK